MLQSNSFWNLLHTCLTLSRGGCKHFWNFLNGTYFMQVANPLYICNEWTYLGVEEQVSEPVFIPPAYANDGQPHAPGAEAEHVSVGAEGSHCVGAVSGGAEPAGSLPDGNCPAAILTLHHHTLRLHLSTTGHTDGSNGAKVDHLRNGRPQLTDETTADHRLSSPLFSPPPLLPHRLLSLRGRVLTLGTYEMLWSYYTDRLYLSLFRPLRINIRHF